MITNRGLYLHTGFRTRGSALWHSLSACKEFAPLYEPLHEALGDRGGPPRQSPQDWNSGHSFAGDYWALAEDVISTNELELFDASFSFDSYWLTPEQSSPGLEAYVLALRDRQAGAGKVPLWKFSRSLGRIGWLKARLGGLHIHVTRDREAEFLSWLTQARKYGNWYFFGVAYRVCANDPYASSEHGVFRSMDAVKGLNDLELWDLFAEYRNRVDAVAREEADWTTSVVELACEPDDRRKFQSLVLEHTGIAIPEDLLRNSLASARSDRDLLDPRYGTLTRRLLGYASDLHQDLSQERARTTELESVLAATRQDAERIADAQTASTHALARQELLIASLEQETKELRVALDRVHQSRSWRLTRPLRSASRRRA